MTCNPSSHATVGTTYCPHCGQCVNPEPVRVQTRFQLQEVADELGVRPDWHEPDEREVTAHVFGESFDNAGFWPKEFNTASIGSSLEMYVELRQHGRVAAYVNLATLFALACGSEM